MRRALNGKSYACVILHIVVRPLFPGPLVDYKLVLTGMCACTGSVGREWEGQGVPLTAAKKSYSVEDITAALDDMIEDNELLRENARADYHGDPRPVSQPSRPSVSADEELDALSQALKGFPPKPKPVPGEEKDEE